MSRRLHAVLLAALALAACGGEPASDTASVSGADVALAPALAPVEPLDYVNPANWLCRPGREDACDQPATATIIAADGHMTTDGFVPAADPLVDCFYVYPTVSRDSGANADARAGAEEREAVRQQLARFGGVCRLYAPVYRQATLTALTKLRAGEDPGINREMAYADVRAAWRHYLEADNAGRGVVLIGHSQGAGLLTRLAAAEIDDKPAKDLLVSALLIGATVEVPLVTSVGGDFKSIPVCAAADSTGCVIAYSSFRADRPPPAASLFGAATTTGMKAACVNPAELSGGNGVLSPLLPAGSILFDELAPPAPWTADRAPVETPFVSLPGLLSAQCVNRGGFNYLAVTVHGDPADGRTDTINGDIVIAGAVRPEWGLHLFDMHLAMGDLVAIVGRQSAAWREGHATASTLPPEFHKQQ